MFRSKARYAVVLWPVAVIAGGVPVGNASGEEKPKPPRLEFRILANDVDEAKAIEAAKKVFASARTDEKVKKELDRLAKGGKPPMPVALKTDKAPGYSWVEMGPAALKSFSLDEETAKDDELNGDWKAARAARARGEAVMLKSYDGGCLLFSRPCVDTGLSKAVRERKRFDYFLLTRDPQKGKAVTGKHLIKAKLSERDDRSSSLAIEFELGAEGGRLFYELTKANRPEQEGDPKSFRRQLAIIAGGKIVSSPKLQEPIGANGVIGGAFTLAEAEDLIEGLKLDIAGKKK